MCEILEQHKLRRLMPFHQDLRIISSKHFAAACCEHVQAAIPYKIFYILKSIKSIRELLWIVKLGLSVLKRFWRGSFIAKCI
jgi:hypothetical protein